MQTVWHDGTNSRLSSTSGVSTIVSTTAVLKGDGNGNVVAAVPGSDYAPATSGTAILKGNGLGGFSVPRRERIIRLRAASSPPLRATSRQPGRAAWRPP